MSELQRIAGGLLKGVGSGIAAEAEESRKAARELWKAKLRRQEIDQRHSNALEVESVRDQNARKRDSDKRDFDVSQAAERRAHDILMKNKDINSRKALAEKPVPVTGADGTMFSYDPSNQTVTPVNGPDGKPFQRGLKKRNLKMVADENNNLIVVDPEAATATPVMMPGADGKPTPVKGKPRTGKGASQRDSSFKRHFDIAIKRFKKVDDLGTETTETDWPAVSRYLTAQGFGDEAKSLAGDTKQVNAFVWKQAQERAEAEAEDKAGFFSSDRSDFSDHGGSRENFITARTNEIYQEVMGGGQQAGGRVGAQQPGTAEAANVPTAQPQAAPTDRSQFTDEQILEAARRALRSGKSGIAVQKKLQELGIDPERL